MTMSHAMIGKEKLSEIRSNVMQAFAKSGIDPDVWIEEELGKANGAVPRNEAEIETLKLVRDGLQAAASRKRRTRSRLK